MANKSTIILLNSIQVDPNNPRQEFDPVELKSLESSIKRNGILTPLAVEEQKGGTFLLVDGERRYRASKSLGLKEVPVVVLPPMSEEERMIKRFNYQEQHLSWSAWEKAYAVDSLRAVTGMTSLELSESLGVKNSTVNRWLQVLNLSKRSAQSAILKKLPIDWLAELGLAVKNVKDEALRQDVEDALIDKIQNKLVVTSREVRMYRQAIQFGGAPLVKKIIENPKYTPRQAAEDAGSSVANELLDLNMSLSRTIRVGKILLDRKRVVVSEAIHRNASKAKKIVDKLIDIDYEEGHKRHNRNPEV